MKKSLIALAVLGFAGTAMAQSSVTMYGVADAGVSRLKEDRVVGVNPNGSPIIKRKYRTGMSSGQLMNNGTSRLGVRGVEDLGGGLKAGFNFETGLSLKDGKAGNSYPYEDNFWSRQAHVWLGGNWGTFDMGRTFTPSFNAYDAWDLSGLPNYSAVANTYGYIGGARADSQFSYKTPNFGGLTAQVAFITKHDNIVGYDVITGEPVGKAKWDLNVIYKNGPIAAAIAANKAKGQKTGYTVGGHYLFGNFGVQASYNDNHKLRRGVSVGAQGNFGPFAVTGNVIRDTKNRLGGKKYTNGDLEAKYALSKRTFVYAAYLRLDKSNNYGVGLRHNF